MIANEKRIDEARQARVRSRHARSRTVLGWLVLGLSSGLFALVLGLAAALIVVPKVTGAVPLTVLTGSMEPALPPGTVVVVRPTSVDRIHTGDVVTYQLRAGDPAVVSHRVVAVRTSGSGELSFVTKGDNNDVADPNPVAPAQVKGVVWYSVPLIGYLSTSLGSERSWLVPLIGAGLLAYASLVAVAGLLELRRRPRRRRGQGKVRGRPTPA